MWQTIAVIAIVLAAATYLAARLRRLFVRGTAGPCGGCAGCPVRSESDFRSRASRQATSPTVDVPVDSLRARRT